MAPKGMATEPNGWGAGKSKAQQTNHQLDAFLFNRQYTIASPLMAGTNYFQPLSHSECQDIPGIWPHAACLLDTALIAAPIKMGLPFTLPHANSLDCWPRKVMACKCEGQITTPGIEAAGEADAAADAGTSSNIASGPKQIDEEFNAPFGHPTTRNVMVLCCGLVNERPLALQCNSIHFLKTLPLVALGQRGGAHLVVRAGVIQRQRLWREMAC